MFLFCFVFAMSLYASVYMCFAVTCWERADHLALVCRVKLVYVDRASRVNFVTIFGDLYQNKLWVICNNLNQFAHLSSASGPSNDVIKMAAIVLLMYTFKTSYLKQ